MKILVTGATGFTGSNLAKKLISNGHKVRCLVRTSSNYKFLQEIGCEITIGDLRNRASVFEAAEGIEIIFNIAAIFRAWGLPDNVYYETHVEGTKNLIDASIENKIKRFIHCSTIGVHGSIKNPPGNEDSPFSPGDIYQKTKLQAEQLVINAFKEKNLPAVIIRPAGIYGPGDTRFLKLFRSIAKKRFLMIGTGKTFWHPVYIDDLIEGLELAMIKNNIEGQTFILGGPEYITLNELVKQIADSLNVPQPIFHIPAKPIQIAGSLCEYLCKPFNIRPPIFRSRVDFFIKNRAFNIEKAKHLLGYYPKYDIIKGIKLTTRWYKENNLL
jgi:nucleoside-diphosphate-sugar epimerase